MKQYAVLALLGCAVIGASSVAGIVRANEMAEKTVDTVHEEAKKAPYTEISAEELQVLIDTKPELVIVDARRESEYVKAHIPGAILLRPNDMTLGQMTQRFMDKDTPMVFYCTDVNCAASSHAAHRAADLGYRVLYKYPGGIADWQEKGLPIATN